MKEHWAELVNWAIENGWTEGNPNDIQMGTGIAGYRFYLRNANCRGPRVYDKHRLELYTIGNQERIQTLRNLAPIIIEELIELNIPKNALDHHDNGNTNIYRLYLNLDKLYSTSPNLNEITDGIQIFTNHLIKRLNK